MTTADADHAHAMPAPEGGDHGHGAHNPHLAHHFDTPEQQYETSKLGMWIFLGTEILMFGGLFCAYSIYRGNHPEVFLYAHNFLGSLDGAINTAVLIASSFTMAWGVRAAQLGHKGLLCIMLLLTFIGGGTFIAMHTMEYHELWEHQVGLGQNNAYHTKNGDAQHPGAREQTIQFLKSEEAEEGELPSATNQPMEGPVGGEDKTAEPAFPASVNQAEPVKLSYARTRPVVPADAWYKPPSDSSLNQVAAPGPPGTNAAFLGDASLSDYHLVREHGHAALQWDDLSPAAQQRTSVFFQIYFLMTGLHSIHVLVGMALMVWLLFRAGGALIKPLVYPILSAVAVLYFFFFGMVVGNWGWWLWSFIGFFALLTGALVFMDLGYRKGGQAMRYAVYPVIAVGAAIYFVICALVVTAWAWWIWIPVGLLVIAALGLIALGFAKRKPDMEAEFGPSYFLPVDLVGLYWHLVDIIWIFLFPLLYLIH